MVPRPATSNRDRDVGTDLTATRRTPDPGVPRPGRTRMPVGTLRNSAESIPPVGAACAPTASTPPGRTGRAARSSPDSRIEPRYGRPGADDHSGALRKSLNLRIREIERGKPVALATSGEVAFSTAGGSVRASDFRIPRREAEPLREPFAGIRKLLVIPGLHPIAR